MKKLTKEEFVERAKSLHGDKYDYTETVYKTYRDTVFILCPEHGVFTQKARDHLIGHGCFLCGRDKTLSTIIVSFEEFLQRAISRHGDLYDYSKAKYTNAKTSIEIICRDHGSFWQEPSAHINLKRGNIVGCPKCGRKRMSDHHLYSTDLFVRLAKNTHGDKYDYTDTIYENCHIPVSIRCKAHDCVFIKSPTEHLKGSGCRKCLISLPGEDLLKRAKDLFGDHYNYDQSVYVDGSTKVSIKCNRHNIVFNQRMYEHLSGKRGCRMCSNAESMGEREIRLFLELNDFSYETEKTFPTCKGASKLLRFDFYISSLNLLIEFDGIHHFEAIEGFGGEDHLLMVQRNDKVKNQWCEDNDYDLLRINYKNMKKIDQILNELILNKA